jgi:hypothetical protein
MDVANFVSKRLQRAVVAILCLIAVQMALALPSCEAELVPLAGKVAITR